MKFNNKLFLFLASVFTILILFQSICRINTISFYEHGEEEAESNVHVVKIVGEEDINSTVNADRATTLEVIGTTSVAGSYTNVSNIEKDYIISSINSTQEVLKEEEKVQTKDSADSISIQKATEKEKITPSLTSRKNQQLRRERYQCLSFENEMNKILQSTKQVFITMPAKASGSSLKAFTKQCVNNDRIPDNNFMKNETFVQEMIRNMYDLPNIIACHVGDEIPAFIRLIKGATIESLIIYVYRDETDRLLSSIKMAASRLCSGQLKNLKQFEVKTHREEDKCIIEEDGLRDLVKSRRVELGKGIFDSLSCTVFKEMDDSKPRIIFMNYKQADRLQMVLARHFCPNLISNNESGFPIHKNDGASKVGMYVKTLNDNTTYVTVDEWGQYKKHTMEWMLGLKDHVTCQSRVRRIQKELISCKDELIWY